MPKYLDPKADLTFKKIFGQHKHLVMSLLNALLPLPTNINAGTAKATITGKGNYSGTVEKTFTIDKTTSRTNKHSLPKIIFAEIAVC